MRLRIRFNGERGASAEGITLFDLTSAEILRVNLRLNHLHLMAVPKADRYLGAFCPIRKRSWRGPTGQEGISAMTTSPSDPHVPYGP
ncbi:MAG: hypothetical protein ACE5G5_13940 [Candidatus Methylomirabilales bacterium]